MSVVSVGVGRASGHRRNWSASSKVSNPEPRARIGLVVFGVLLAAISVILGYVSWLWYLDGRPAVIASTGSHPGIGLDVYTSTDVSVDLYVGFSPGVVGGTGMVVIPRFRTERTSPFVFVIELTDDARFRPAGLVGGSVSLYIPKEDNGYPFVTRRQIFVSSVDPKELNGAGYSGQAGIGGETLGSYVQRSGFRVSAHLPAINRPISCRQLDQVDVRVLQSSAASEEGWDNLIDPCNSELGERGDA